MITDKELEALADTYLEDLGDCEYCDSNIRCYKAGFREAESRCEKHKKRWQEDANRSLELMAITIEHYKKQLAQCLASEAVLRAALEKYRGVPLPDENGPIKTPPYVPMRNFAEEALATNSGAEALDAVREAIEILDGYQIPKERWEKSLDALKKVFG